MCVSDTSPYIGVFDSLYSETPFNDRTAKGSGGRTMRIFVIDDEKAALDELRDAISRIRPGAEVMLFETADAAMDAIARLRSAPDKLRVQCFGYFDVFWHGKPLAFSRSKSKELLAYLVDREGANCAVEEIIIALWEDGAEGKDTKHYLRVLTSELTAVLKGIGMQDVLLKKRGQLAVNRDRLDCDYYRMRSGDAACVSAYRGEYMKQYSWAEVTAGRLYFQTMEYLHRE